MTSGLILGLVGLTCMAAPVFTGLPLWAFGTTSRERRSGKRFSIGSFTLGAVLYAISFWMVS